MKVINSTMKHEWAKYINSFQDEKNGFYIGPEIVEDELASKVHSREHILYHLICHVLPALDLLNAKPRYVLKFAHKYLNTVYLERWLNERNWANAWLEGNNLLFVMQLLVYLRDMEGKSEAYAALNFLFDWLDKQQDPMTGLWGTNGFCDNFAAMCGGYHQLIGYFFLNKDIQYKKTLIDTVLSLQHRDGGFNPRGGGGACEDVDGVFILVNLYQQLDYKRKDIKHALEKNLKNIMRNHMRDGGFVYRKNKRFSHMGILKTQSPKNKSNMFATWFRVHTIALISQVLDNTIYSEIEWNFNRAFSMGWCNTIKDKGYTDV
ncbi:MAG: hypothetical protein ACMUJM_20820 [bacterium]